MYSGQGFSLCVWPTGLFLIASLLVSWGCKVDLFPSFLSLWDTFFGLVFWLFSVGHGWPLLCLGGSGVLSQGAGYGVLECVFFSLDETIR